MELFVIHCTTCHARLKVQNESIIGEILSCPKCQSFVQVVPPPDWKPSKPAVVAAAAVTAPPPVPKAKAKPGPDLRNAYKTPSHGTAPTIQTTALSKTVVAAPPVPAPVPGSVVPPPVTAPPVTAAAVAIPPAMGEVATATSPWQAITLRLQRDKWLIGGAFAAGAAIGIGMWIALGSQSTSVAETPEQPAVQTPVSESELATQPEKPAAVEPSAQPVVEEPAVTTPEPKPAEPVAPVDKPAEPEPAKPVTPAPVDDGLSNLLPGAEKKPAEPQTAATTPAATLPVTPQPETPQPATPVTAKPAPAKPATADMPSTVLTDAQIDTRLGERMLSLEFSNAPLGRYVEFLSQFSTLPIIIDRDGLASVGKGAASPVTVSLKQTTVADALRAALAPHGLIYVIHNGHLIITIPRAK